MGCALLIQTAPYMSSLQPTYSMRYTQTTPRDHKNFRSTWKKVMGKFNDECGDKQVSEFVGLRFKMYIYKVDGFG